MRKELSGQIVGLRRAVIEHRTSVIGHGVLIGELGADTHRSAYSTVTLFAKLRG